MSYNSTGGKTSTLLNHQLRSMMFQENAKYLFFFLDRLVFWLISYSFFIDNSFYPCQITLLIGIYNFNNHQILLLFGF